MINVFNLRGNQRTSGDLSRREGGKIFGSGSRTPIAITLLVRNPAAKGKAQIHYHDIGDYLSREEKLERIKKFASVMSPEMQLSSITPNEENDWLNQRDGLFDTFIPMEADKKFNTDLMILSGHTYHNRKFELPEGWQELTSYSATNGFQATVYKKVY